MIAHQIEPRKQPQDCGREHYCPLLNDEAIEAIAERAANKAVEKMTAMVYQEIGKGFVSKATYVIGVIVLAAGLWLNARGFIKWP